MRVPRVYIESTLAINERLQLPKQVAHHLVNVLRLKAGQTLTVFNGQGGEYSAHINHLDKRQADILINEFIAIDRESPVEIHLGQVLARGEKMDWIIQKSVELGVKQITPLFSQYCNVKLPADRIEKRVRHWEAVIISACEQSGRTAIPLIHPPIQLDNWLAQTKADQRFICHPELPKTSNTMNSPQTIAIAIGPEGGFSDAEIKQAMHHQFTSLNLGPRVLRTETAGLTAITVIQSSWGDL